MPCRDRHAPEQERACQAPGVTAAEKIVGQLSEKPNELVLIHGLRKVVGSVKAEGRVTWLLILKRKTVCHRGWGEPDVVTCLQFFTVIAAKHLVLGVEMLEPQRQSSLQK